MKPNQLILTINGGSSSVKFSLISVEKQKTILHGLIERISQPDCRLRLTDLDHQASSDQLANATYQDAFLKIKEILKTNELLDQISAIGHRVVHGGHLFKGAVLINETVIEQIRSLIPLAPLHNPHNLAGIEFCQAAFLDMPQVAVFDTSFHQSIPETHYLYAIPYELYEKHHIRKYGFHGISHQYLSQKADEILAKKNGNYISLHLGNGCSMTAIKEGKSFDTSMGFTPLDGLIMGTRTGALDPSVVIFLAQNLGLSVDEIDQLLNKKSGLFGISQQADMRNIEQLKGQNDPKAALALNLFSQRISFYLSAYYHYFDQLDAIIFSGGIGEHSSLVRQMVIEQLKNLNFKIDIKQNQTHGKSNHYHINQKDTPSILVIPTDEELMIAKEAMLLV